MKLAMLDARRLPPRPWRDDRAPWGDPEFSRAWARTSALGPRRARQEAAFLAGLVPRRARAVDLGCGEGRTARALARRGVEVVGIDLGPGAIEAAVAACPVRGCRFRVGDLARETYPEGPFDLAYAIDGTLAGFRPAAAARVLARVARALAPGGRLVLDLPSVAMAEALDTRQDWYVDRDSPVGAFPQLLLTEDFYLRAESAYIHRAWSVALADGTLRSFSQTYHIYTLGELEGLLARAGLVLAAAHGEFGPDRYEETESLRLVAVAEVRAPGPAPGERAALGTGALRQTGEVQPC